MALPVANGAAIRANAPRVWVADYDRSYGLLIDITAVWYFVHL